MTLLDRFHHIAIIYTYIAMCITDWFIIMTSHIHDMNVHILVTQCTHKIMHERTSQTYCYIRT